MWRVETIKAISVTLDFTSSGSGLHTATAVDAGEVRLVNAAELVEYGRNRTQVQVCEECGTPRCRPGSWVTMWRAEALVVWTPAWHEMERGETEREEFGPPAFFATRGAPVFVVEGWARMRELLPGLPATDDLPSLTATAALRAVQWAAPGCVLGQFPAAPRLQKEMVLATTGRGTLGAVNAALARLDDNTVLKPVFPAPTGRVELHLDLPGFPIWAPFAFSEDVLQIPVDDQLALGQ